MEVFCMIRGLKVFMNKCLIVYFGILLSSGFIFSSDNNFAKAALSRQKLTTGRAKNNDRSAQSRESERDVPVFFKVPIVFNGVTYPGMGLYVPESQWCKKSVIQPKVKALYGNDFEMDSWIFIPSGSCYEVSILPSRRRRMKNNTNN